MTGLADNALLPPASAAQATSARPAVFLMTNSFDTGGSERQFVALAGALSGGPFRAQIGCLAKQGSLLEGFESSAEFPVGGSLYGWNSIRARLRLARHLRESRLSVAHAFDFYTNLVLIPAARKARVPVIIGSQRQLGDLLGFAKSQAQLAALRWCDAVVCNSRSAADLLTNQGLPARQIVVIRNGLPDSAFAPNVPALRRPPSLLRVGMIARMNAPSKNHALFLRVAAVLCCKFDDIEFVLAGDGPLRPELERQSKALGLGDRVHFLGDRRDIPAILASVDVSVLPSSSESLSNAILESMAAGVPVVATRVGGNTEIVTHDRGRLVAAGDEQGLVEAVENLLLNPPMRADLGHNAKVFTRANFTMQHMRRRHEELYEELLSRKTRRNRRLFLPRSGNVRTPLTVAIVAPSMHYVGGQSVQAELLLSYWRNDPDVRAHFVPIDPPFPRWLQWAHRVPFLRTILREPIYLASLWQGMGGADAVHIFSASYWSFLIAAAPAWLIARLRGKKTLINYHSGEARDHLRRSRLARFILSRADRLVVPSQYLVDVFREFNLVARDVPNIVDLSEFAFRPRAPLRPHLLCTRGFHPYYRVDLVVHAFAEVQRKFPQARLDLVGHGPLEREIRDLVRLLSLKHVNFSGVASRGEIGCCYDAADIFINASALDNMPVSIMEAFACGTPVVSTAPEGIRYLVEHERTGLLSPPGDASALARNVVRLLRDPDLCSRIVSNAHTEAHRYCWTEIRGRWLEAYQALAPQCPKTSQKLVSAA